MRLTVNQILSAFLNVFVFRTVCSDTAYLVILTYGGGARTPSIASGPGQQGGDGAGIAPAEKRTAVKFGLGMKKPGGKTGAFRRR